MLSVKREGNRYAGSGGCSCVARVEESSAW